MTESPSERVHKMARETGDLGRQTWEALRAVPKNAKLLAKHIGGGPLETLPRLPVRKGDRLLYRLLVAWPQHAFELGQTSLDDGRVLSHEVPAGKWTQTEIYWLAWLVGYDRGFSLENQQAPTEELKARLMEQLADSDRGMRDDEEVTKVFGSKTGAFLVLLAKKDNPGLATRVAFVFPKESS